MVNQWVRWEEGRLRYGQNGDGVGWRGRSGLAWVLNQSLSGRFPGVGYAICLIDIYMGMYYNTIIGWAVYYLFASFTSKLPWTSCDNPWNTQNCMPVTSENFTQLATTPAKEFFEWVPHE